VSGIFSVYNFCEAKILNERLQMDVFATKKTWILEIGVFFVVVLYFFREQACHIGPGVPDF